MKKRALTIVLVVVIAFAVFNTVWFAWSRSTYGKLSDGMEAAEFNTVFDRRYFYSDAERYDYSVKYPNYLSFTGNMSVGIPTTGDNPFTDALIIWPKLTGGYELGALLYDEDGTGYSVYIDEKGNALSVEDEDVVLRHSDNIRILLIKADERWGIFDPN